MQRKWDRQKTQVKANLTAARGTAGAVGGGGGAAFVIGFIRANWPELLPWPVEQDAVVVGVLAALGAGAWGWLRTYRTDKEKHGG